MLAIVAGMDLVRLGPWLGLTAAKISAALDLFEEVSTKPQRADSSLSDITKMYAEKIVIPVFSTGLQGTLIGFFYNLEPHHKLHVRSALDQAGRQLAEELALERKMSIQKLLIQNGFGAKTLADIVIQVASPVEHVIACSPEGYYGYVICREENYLAGYGPKAGEDAARLIEDPANEVIESPILDPPFKIYLKTLQKDPSIDPVFHSLRVQTALFDIWSARNVPAVIISSTEFDADAPALTREELDQVIAALEHQMTTEHGKRSVAKYLCFLEAVRRNYSTREVRLSNHEMQRRMSERLASSKINGYQVTGKALRKFELDIDRLLPGKIAFRELNGRVIHVSWNKDLF